MSTGQKLLLAVVLVAAAVAGLFEARVIAREGATLAAWRQRVGELEKKVATLARDRDAATRELALAESQLARLPAPPAAPVGSEAQQRATAIKDWLGHLKHLHQLFDQQPAQTIPEMALLTDEDWLDVARRLDLTTDKHRRKALSDLRGTAKSKFAAQMSNALIKYQQAGQDTVPTTFQDLLPYFETPPDPAMLDRYAFAASGKIADLRNRPGSVILEKSPIDDTYDSRIGVSFGGYGGSSGVTAWIDGFDDQFRRAASAFRAANPNYVSDSNGKMAELLPYFDPPLPPATVEKLIKAERERAP